MKIGVLADTHVMSAYEARQLAQRLLVGPFADIDVILHAGDHVYNDLGLCFAPAPWYAVRGNCDHALIDAPARMNLRLNDKRIGLIHGWGQGSHVVTNVLAAFADHMPDVLVFGHTHQPECRQVGSTLLFNPGSATNPRSAPAPTVGVLSLGDVISAEIIPLA